MLSIRLQGMFVQVSVGSGSTTSIPACLAVLTCTRQRPGVVEFLGSSAVSRVVPQNHVAPSADQPDVNMMLVASVVGAGLSVYVAKSMVDQIGAPASSTLGVW